MSPKICYQTRKFKASTLVTIEQANEIIEKYTAEGYELTLRQLYYQFVSRNLIPNHDKEYDKLGSIINDARLAGLVDWDAIVDRTRNLRSLSHWESPAEIAQGCVDSYRIDKWADQPHRLEVWIEKDALVGVIERACNLLDVPFFSCRGYTSQSEMWAAAQRLQAYRDAGQEPIIIHLGDHDPSGIDMTRDIDDRLALFMDGQMEVKRVALNMDQVKTYSPPPNPAKLTDSRCRDYISKFGNKSWELDALEPKVIDALVQRTIKHYRDGTRWNLSKDREEEGRSRLASMVEELSE